MDVGDAIKLMDLGQTSSF